MISRPVSPLVPLQRMKVVRLNLAGGKIEKPAPMLTATTDQIHIGMVHPHHKAAMLEVVCLTCAHHTIKRQTPCRAGHPAAQATSVPSPLHHQRPGVEANQVCTCSSARRLQPQKDACRLKQGCLALCVAPHQDCRPGMQLQRCLRKATEVAHFDFTEHPARYRQGFGGQRLSRFDRSPTLR